MLRRLAAGSSSSTYLGRTATQPANAWVTTTAHRASNGTVQPPVTSYSTPKPNGPMLAIR